eukprot:CAMPEP_0198488734 /NCGR_PEP_ID=MMETSP1462-20131121/959_1 /TAXON_ID=1333877 /ORGANISM="Brandtodinium nutriculum, Strain RCC3387" /LENGTH=45 /DNA_ID= /DNA_START= /DNA_END= /DNA_ORIENTATION=
MAALYHPMAGRKCFTDISLLLKPAPKTALTNRGEAMLLSMENMVK